MTLLAASALAAFARAPHKSETTRTAATAVLPKWTPPINMAGNWRSYTHAMVTSTDAEISEHNRAVNTRQVRRRRERMEAKERAK